MAISKREISYLDRCRLIRHVWLLTEMRKHYSTENAASYATTKTATEHDETGTRPLHNGRREADGKAVSSPDHTSEDVRSPVVIISHVRRHAPCRRQGECDSSGAHVPS
jgi:hypothetical protein